MVRGSQKSPNRVLVWFFLLPLADNKVDRSEVEAQQCVQLTDTNRSRA